jgi:broad specificity phosphatase PhoE
VTTRLLLIVHAGTAATRAARFPLDEGLDDRGQADAVAAAASLDGRARLVCGNALRCRQTAAALQGGPPPAPDALDGRLDDWELGSWAGRTLAEVGAQDPAGTAAWLEDPDAAPHGGESLTELLHRVGSYLTNAAGHPGHHVAVTHASIVRGAVVHVLGAGPAGFWRVDVVPLTRVLLSAHAGRWNLRLP